MAILLCLMSSERQYQIRRALSLKHQRDEIALTKIENFMDAQMDKVLACPDCGKEYENVKVIEPAQATLIRARYDKLRPTLSAVEQANIDESDKLSEADIMAKLRALVGANPDLIRTVLDAQRSPPESDFDRAEVLQ